MTSLKNILFLLFFLLSISANAKTYAHYHFSKEDGLPSSEVYSSVQDENGFMWFATDRGVVRFDGYKFDVFTKEDGLPNNVILRTYKDQNNKIWFLSLTGELSYFHNNEIRLYEQNDLIKQSRIGSPISFCIDSTGGIHIGGKYGYLNIDSSGSIVPNRLQPALFNIIKINDDLIYCRKPDFKNKNIPLHYFTTLYFYSGEEVSNHKIIERKTASYDLLYINVRAAKSNHENTFFSIGNSLFKKNDGKISLIHKTEKEIISIEIKDDQIWLGVFQSNIEIISINPVTINEQKYHLDFTSASSVLFDQQNGAWITTLDNGIYYIPELNHHSYNGLGDKNSTFHLELDKETLLITDQTGNINLFNLETETTLTIKKIPSDKANKAGNINGIYLKNGSFLIINKSFLFNYNSQTEEIKLQEDIAPHLFMIRDDTLFLVRHKDRPLVKYHFPITIKRIPVNRSLLPNVECVFVTKNNNILLGTAKGIIELREKDPNSFFYLTEKHPLFSSRVIKFIDYPSFDFIAASKGNGLLFVKNNTPYSINKKHGLVSDDLTALHLDTDRNIWLGSSDGISIIDSNGVITNLKIANGLLSNEVTSIFTTPEKAYIGTKKGLTILDKSSIFKSEIDIPVFMEVNKLNLTKTNEVFLKYQEPLIRIQFVGLDYKSMGKIQYRYRLNPFEEWNYSAYNFLLFTNLASGDYKLEIQASNNGKNWSRQSAISEIHVAFPFWRTWTFIICATILLLLCFYLIYKTSINRLKKREGIKHQIQSLRYEALSAQMNPHFMFNSLNSIQNFIMTNDRKQSTRYLAKFAKLMRKTLDHSLQKNITLSEEIEALEIYLELESLRFDGQIISEITIDNSLDIAKTIVPALLIQPIVENSILHGLRPKSNGGKVIIHCIKKDTQLLISVEDDGVGRENGKSSSKHTSKGKVLTQERIQLFAKENNGQSKFSITDIDKKSKTGTIVNLMIPLILKNETNRDNN